MGGYHYHYQISFYALTHGPVVISRLDDHTLQRLPLHTHTHSPTSPLFMYVHTDAQKHSHLFTPCVNACALAPARQRPSTL